MVDTNILWGPAGHTTLLVIENTQIPLFNLARMQMENIDFSGKEGLKK